MPSTLENSPHFDERLLSITDFMPHDYASLKEVRAFPEGGVPEPAYRQLEEKYRQVDDVEVSRIVYESDGYEVTGLMAAPRDMTPGNHPIIVYNRGGSREYGKLTLVNIMRVLVPFARQGYLVFASNYRGNDGGSGKEEFGGADVNDVLTLLDIAHNHPGHDGQNSYMIGHSRGGMMTYLALKHGAQVNAAISVAAPSDLVQAGEERPDMQRLFNELIPDKGEAPSQALKERSATQWAELLSTPLLLLHGDADEVVNVSHSRRLASLLPHAQYIEYTKGGHALIRQWNDVLESMSSWLETHKRGSTS